METSAKTGHNARNVLLEAAKLLYKDYLNERNNKDKNNTIKKDTNNCYIL